MVIFYFSQLHGYSYAKKLNADFYIQIKYPHLTPFNEYNFLQNKFNFYNGEINNCKTYLIQETEDQKFIQLPIIQNTNFILDGYFQSQNYFNKQLIQQIFKCPENISSYILQKYNNLSQFVGISIRRRRLFTIKKYIYGAK